LLNGSECKENLLIIKRILYGSQILPESIKESDLTGKNPSLTQTEKPARYYSSGSFSAI